MTLLEKLQKYETAVDLLDSIPGYPWPGVSLAWGVTRETNKTEGLVNVQAWYDVGDGWKVVISQRWKDDSGKTRSDRQIAENLNATGARDAIEGVV